MSVTAARMGHAPLTWDWTNFTRINSTGQVIAPASFADSWAKLKGQFDRKEVGFYGAPSDNSLSQLSESQELAARISREGTFQDCLILGIGGSSLGPLSLLAALKEKCMSPIRFHFMENPDPLEFGGTLRGLDPSRTLVCAITKSGTTFETLAQLQVALEWLGKERWKTHLVAITDPEKGDLKTLARELGIPTLHIAPSIGGRFSVFSPVGLFPAALAGLKCQEFLAGAQAVRDFVEKAPMEKNPVFILAAEFLKHYPKRPIHVCMPYSSRLRAVGDWFVQLWGESLGKDGKGFTPLAALGATDQHSILQLLRDGPDDKITLFITVDQVGDKVQIPRPLRTERVWSKLPSFAQLEGHTLAELLTIEYRAISLVLTKRGRPHLSLQLDRLDERSMGALYFAFSVLTAFTGTIWGVNPFDQPGVEEGKNYIRDSLNESRAAQRPEEDENSPVNRLRRHQTEHE